MDNNKDEFNLDENLESFFIGFTKIPKDNQIIIIGSLIESFHRQKIEKIKKHNSLKCYNEGHIYREWQESIGYNFSMKYKYWYKKCERCGNIKTSYDKPFELFKKDVCKKLLRK